LFFPFLAAGVNALPPPPGEARRSA
jgi:hypothetical protein